MNHRTDIVELTDREPSIIQRVSSAELTAEQRLRELSRILAVGVLRLRRSQPPVARPSRPATADKSAAGRLDVPAKTVLSVHTGERFRELETPGAKTC